MKKPMTGLMLLESDTQHTFNQATRWHSHSCTDETHVIHHMMTMLVSFAHAVEHSTRADMKVDKTACYPST